MGITSAPLFGVAAASYITPFQSAHRGHFSGGSTSAYAAHGQNRVAEHTESLNLPTCDTVMSSSIKVSGGIFVHGNKISLFGAFSLRLRATGRAGEGESPSRLNAAFCSRLRRFKRAYEGGEGGGERTS